MQIPQQMMWVQVPQNANANPSKDQQMHIEQMKTPRHETPIQMKLIFEIKVKQPHNQFLPGVCTSNFTLFLFATNSPFFSCSRFKAFFCCLNANDPRAGPPLMVTRGCTGISLFAWRWDLSLVCCRWVRWAIHVTAAEGREEGCASTRGEDGAKTKNQTETSDERKEPCSEEERQMRRTRERERNKNNRGRVHVAGGGTIRSNIEGEKERGRKGVVERGWEEGGNKRGWGRKQ